MKTLEEVLSMAMLGLAAYDIQNNSNGGPMVFITNPALTASILQQVQAVFAQTNPAPTTAPVPTTAATAVL